MGEGKIEIYKEINPSYSCLTLTGKRHDFLLLSLTASTSAATITMVTITNTVTTATTSVTKDRTSVSMATTGVPSSTSVVTSVVYATVMPKKPVVTSAIYATVASRTPPSVTFVTSDQTPVATTTCMSSTSMTTSVVTDNRIQVEAVIHRDPHRPASTYDHELASSSIGSKSRSESSASSIFDPTYATIADLDLAPKVETSTNQGQMMSLHYSLLFSDFHY